QRWWATQPSGARLSRGRWWATQPSGARLSEGTASRSFVLRQEGRQALLRPALRVGHRRSRSRPAARWGERVQVQDVRQGGDAGAAGPYPGDDVLRRRRVVDQPEPHRPASGGTSRGGG